MTEKKTENFNLNAQNEKTAFELLGERIKTLMFGVTFVLLKQQSFSVWAEMVFIILQFLQFMAFAFRPVFASIWKNENSSQATASFLQYFQVVMFFKNDSSLYIIAFVICVVLIVLLLINIFYVAVAFAKNPRLNTQWPVKILRIYLTFVVSVCFLPIFEILISIFKCVDPTKIQTVGRLLQTSTTTTTTTVTTVNYFAPTITCGQGAYLGYAAVSIIFSLLLIGITLVVQMTYFETMASTQNQTAKSTSKSDIFKLFAKVICVIMYAFISDAESNQWLLILVTFFLALFMFMAFYMHRPYFNASLSKLSLVCWGLFLWTNFVLMIGKIFENSSYDGSLALMFLGGPIIIAVILTNYSNRLTILMSSNANFRGGESVAQQVTYYLDLVDRREFDRECKLLLKGYIFIYEESCASQICALKKYLWCVDNNEETISSLIQHAEVIYHTGISKFPSCTSLRIAFSYFLMERMNKKQQAVDELINATKHNPTFEEQFIIYRFQSMLNDQSDVSEAAEDSLDVVSNIVYKTHLNQFKNCIIKVATLYVDFWSLLMNQDSSSDLSKLNEYGTLINQLVKEITEHFEKMQKLKHNDPEVLKFYSDFLNDIINDKEKASSFKLRLGELEGTTKKFDEMNYINLDLNALQSSDEYQYLIMSGMMDKFGLITNVSLGICSMFGYNRNEVIGQNVEVVMPEIFHASHRVMLTAKINDYKKITMSVQNARNYKASFTDVNSVGVNKSRYLVPFMFKVTFVPNNEQSESVFLSKVASDVYKSGDEKIVESCNVLITTSFIIQNFTGNSIIVLGMDTSLINNTNVSFVDYIHEFAMEYLKYSPEMEDKTKDQVNLVKAHILMKMFKSPVKVTWTKKKTTDNTEVHYDYLNLSVTDIIIANKRQGFIFKFDMIVEAPKVTPDAIKKDRTQKNKYKESTVHETSMFANLDVTQEIDKQLNFDEANKKNAEVIIETPEGHEEENGKKIDGAFVPDANWNFHLDASKLSYVVNPKNLNGLHEIVKDEAMKKLKIINEPSVVDTESDYSSSSESFDQDIRDESVTKIVQKETKNNKNEDYYKVDYSTIKFLQYELKKDFLVEVPDWIRESQVDAKCKNPHEQSKKEGESDKEETAGANKENLDGTEEEIVDQGKEGILVKQIEYALSKEETQPTITRMKWISFFVFLIYIGFASLFLVLFLSSVALMTENISVIFKSYDLIQDTIYAVFHTRELVLLNNPKYQNIYQPESDYIKNNTALLLNLFNSNYLLIIGVVTSFLPVTVDHYFALNNKTVTTTIVQDDLSVKHFALTLNSAYTQSTTALYHIAHLTVSEIFATNKDVFFYMYNSLNDVALELYLRAVIYMQELGFNVSAYQLTFLYIFLGATIFGILSYFIITYSYVAVEKRKESYLEVFFEINTATIKDSLGKCEDFTKKIQNENMSDAVSNLDDAELNENAELNGMSTIKKVSVIKKKGNKSGSKEARAIKIKLGLGIAIISAFFFLIYFMYSSYLSNLQIYANIFQVICLQQTEYLQLFNTLREYFFDVNNNVNSTAVSQYIDMGISQIYNSKLGQDIEMANYQSSYPTSFAKLYSSIIKDDICSYSTDFFNTFLSSVNCTRFVSNSSSYGLNVLLTNYVEEIRYSKYRYDLMLQNAANYKDINYNNTIIGSPFEMVSKNPNYNSNDPFEVFNDPSHLNLVILTRFFLRPAYEALKLELVTDINNSITSFQTIYIVVFIFYFTLVLFLYLFLWRPFENDLNLTIYKTKNMLQIIPKEVLASLSNIHKLLDIGQSNNKKNRQMKA